MRKSATYAFSVMLILLNFGCFPQRFYQISSKSDYTRQRIAELITDLQEAPDDPLLYDTDRLRDTCLYRPTLSEPYWIVPGPGIPNEVKPQRANNNVAICVYQKRLYIAFRTSPHHFASRRAAIYVISSQDLLSWRQELIIREGRDVREPHLIVLGDTLHLYYFVGGTKPWAFEPDLVRHYAKVQDTLWHSRAPCLSSGEVPWDMKKRYGKLFLSSYRGSHYKLGGTGRVHVHFRVSSDGHNFTPVGNRAVVYTGGASECAFEFDADSTLWVVTRLDDGDTNGFGSQVGWAPKSHWHQWHMTPPDPNCYMSPKLFRHKDQIYLVARRQLSIRPFGWADRRLPLWSQRLLNWILSSLSPMTTSLYRLNKAKKQIEWITDLPGTGDTAFPSIQRLTENTFLIANYSGSPVKSPPWFLGQLRPTGIYLILVTFTPASD